MLNLRILSPSEVAKATGIRKKSDGAASKRCQETPPHMHMVRFYGERDAVLYASNLPAKTAVPPELAMGYKNFTLAAFVFEIENKLLQWYIFLIFSQYVVLEQCGLATK